MQPVLILELMECVLKPLRSPSSTQAKTPAVSTLGGVATAAQASLLPYFATAME